MAEDPYRYFRVEAAEILEHLSRGALDLEKQESAGVVAGLLRAAHTLKGAARVVKQREIADCSHELEDALAHVKNAPGPVPRDRVDRVLAIVDRIGGHVAQLPVPNAPPPTARSGQPDQPLTAPRPANDDLDALLAGVFETQARLAAIRSRLAHADRANSLSTLVVDQLMRSGDTATVRAGQAGSDRVRSMAEELRDMVGAVTRDLAVGFDQIDQELKDVRHAAERLRLAPTETLFTFLERAVRDAAVALDKHVAFEGRGGDVRVDAFVLNVVQGALLHVVRNAVTHGIEGGDERRAAGKPPVGRVIVNVSQRGRLVSFTCTDDGRGINLAAVRRIAQRRGMAVEDGAAVEVEQLLRVLFEGGISTTSAVTDLAGRGVGLDVVRDAAERLGGAVTARTEAGLGTTIEIVVPLSIASFEALIVEVLGRSVAIPLDAVRGTLRLGGDGIIRTGPRESLVFDGQAIPLASLRQILTPGSPPGPGSAVIVVRGSAGTVALRVDHVVGTAPIVMRPLPSLAVTAAVVSGASLDAVGNPQLILDPDSLADAAQREGQPAVDVLTPRLSVLIVDDSLTTRMLEQSILESAGYDVDLATSGEEGLEKAQSAPYALCLVDVEMPGMDGFTFVERLRADPALRHIPAILVTSRNAPEDLQRGRDVGAQGYMVKSEFAQGVLLERIRALVT